ncbi:hypothetical protein [Catenulispora rubra]|uniref:hypothetical protein n=1 Tax=Catenulispora rubra TaxID=280293 RepID=UPI001892749E|nr:hypothetical protein [Catenulispora rubra]
MTSENDFEDERGVPEDEHAVPQDDQVRDLLAAGLPDFPTTVALGDRALAGAARRRARARTFGGVGAIAVAAGCALAVAPLAGWGGHRPGTANVGSAVAAPGTSSTSSTAPPPSSPSPSSRTSDAVLSPPSRPSTTQSVQPWTNTPKQQAADRVGTALQNGHDNSYMGVLLVNDDNPILVYRKPDTDPTLEHAAIQAAYPFSVVFRDSVLDASEQWYLGHRLNQDTAYWKSQGVTFGTGLQNDGTITIFASDPGTVVPLLEAHYGYDGKVFVGRQWNLTPEPPPSSGSSSGS